MSISNEENSNSVEFVLKDNTNTNNSNILNENSNGIILDDDTSDNEANDNNCFEHQQIKDVQHRQNRVSLILNEDGTSKDAITIESSNDEDSQKGNSSSHLNSNSGGRRSTRSNDATSVAAGLPSDCKKSEEESQEEQERFNDMNGSSRLGDKYQAVQVNLETDQSNRSKIKLKETLVWKVTY